MVKRFWMAFLCAVVAVSGYGLDFTHLTYYPTIFGRAVGTDAVWNRFKGNEYEGRSFSFPISELKFVVARIGGITLTPSIGFTFYREETGADSKSRSGNVSLGIGVGAVGEKEPTSMGGFFMHAYPLYEFPAFTESDPIAPWKIALDAGYALDLGADELVTEMVSLYITFYSRLIGAFADTGGGTTFRLNWPDYGIAVGVHAFYQR